MHPRLLVIGLAALLAGPALAQEAPSREDATSQLSSSPRHGEWAEIATPRGLVTSWLVYPQRPDPAPVVLVVHQGNGLSDWVRSIADAFAEAGFIAIAPDLLSGKGPNGGGTPSFEGDTGPPIWGLDPEEIRERLDAVVDHALSLPAASGHFGVIGFCWGGTAGFQYATSQPDAEAAVIYYGNPPAAEALRNLRVPVLGIYGSNDYRVTATVETTQQTLASIGARYEVEIYEGAGHGFLFNQRYDDLQRAAARAAWPRTITFLRDLLER